jgi:hypothetical protein
MTVREIRESPLRQGEDEVISYRLNTSFWGEGPSDPTVVLKDSAGLDVSTAHLTGLPSIADPYVVTPKVHSLDPGSVYRLEIMFNIGGNTFEAFARIEAEV